MNARLDHIAILVDDLDKGVAFYSDVVGLGAPIVRDFPEARIRCAFFAAIDGPLIELVQFSGRGELAHGDVVVAVEVEDLDAAIAHYRSRGVRVHDQPPTETLAVRRGWVTKADGHGTILELCQRGALRRFLLGEETKAV